MDPEKEMPVGLPVSAPEGTKKAKLTKKERPLSGDYAFHASEASLSQRGGEANTHLLNQYQQLIENLEAGTYKVPKDRGKDITMRERKTIRYAFCVMGWSRLRIAKALKRPQQLIAREVFHLLDLKRRIDRQIVTEAVRNLEKDFEAVIGLSTLGLKRYLIKNVLMQPDMTPKDAKLLSDVVANYHRILQLVQKKPTSVRETIESFDETKLAAVMRETFEKMKQDPMFDAEKYIRENRLESILGKEINLARVQ